MKREWVKATIENDSAYGIQIAKAQCPFCLLDTEWAWDKDSGWIATAWCNHVTFEYDYAPTLEVAFEEED